MVTSSNDEQPVEAFVIVHLNTILPAVDFNVNVPFGLVKFVPVRVIELAPEITVQAPVSPLPAALAASV